MGTIGRTCNTTHCTEAAAAVTVVERFCQVNALADAGETEATVCDNDAYSGALVQEYSYDVARIFPRLFCAIAGCSPLLSPSSSTQAYDGVHADAARKLPAQWRYRVSARCPAGVLCVLRGARGVAAPGVSPRVALNVTGPSRFCGAFLHIWGSRVGGTDPHRPSAPQIRSQRLCS